MALFDDLLEEGKDKKEESGKDSGKEGKNPESKGGAFNWENKGFFSYHPDFEKRYIKRVK